MSRPRRPTGCGHHTNAIVPTVARPPPPTTASPAPRRRARPVGAGSRGRRRRAARSAPAAASGCRSQRPSGYETIVARARTIRSFRTSAASRSCSRTAASTAVALRRARGERVGAAHGEGDVQPGCRVRLDRAARIAATNRVATAAARAAVRAVAVAGHEAGDVVQVAQVARPRAALLQSARDAREAARCRRRTGGHCPQLSRSKKPATDAATATRAGGGADDEDGAGAERRCRAARERLGRRAACRARAAPSGGPAGPPGKTRPTPRSRRPRASITLRSGAPSGTS